MPPTPQEIYATAQNMAEASPITRALIFAGLGGEFWPADPKPATYDEFNWTVRLYGLTEQDTTQNAAIEKWVKSALRLHQDNRSARAADGRPDCPYNGAALLPPASTRVAEAT
ncbi:hypothetical protein [Leisingera sp. ANG-DT]|uniref:hypothetical protein n=1 Tax=Leisingera sp. ANG-DT TaxID=1577897 RepID=UPI00057C59EE|nr:hypothetical protein [Leisingera sp. ANG-DT]KIC19634.1 hypothetical protein RA21_03855 [Leisingera sp. ANG-DT]